MEVKKPTGRGGGTTHAWLTVAHTDNHVCTCLCYFNHFVPITLKKKETQINILVLEEKKIEVVQTATF